MPVQNSGDHSPGELAMLRRLQYRTPESYHNSRYVQSHNLLAIMVMDNGDGNDRDLAES